jgi:hypothetical protein
MRCVICKKQLFNRRMKQLYSVSDCGFLRLCFCDGCIEKKDQVNELMRRIEGIIGIPKSKDMS